MSFVKLNCIRYWLLISCFFSSQAFSEVELETWTEVDATTDIADPAGEILSKELSTRLLAENSKTVFINVAKCTPNISEAVAWCESFKSFLATSLIKNGLRFLPESAADEIREKIAKEQVYQLNSMQVEPLKAVEIGKQKSFQAFVNITVNGDGNGNINLSANSINIRDGLVTISENVHLKMKRENIRPWSVWFKGWLFMGTGIAGTVYGLYQADQSQQKSDDYFTQYKKADNEADAVSYRKKVEKQDKATKLYNTGSAISVVLAFYGFYTYQSKEDVLSYRINVAGTRNESISTKFVSLDLKPIITPSLMGIGISTNW